MSNIIQSPGGSNFPYYYKGGEIHCLKYGSYYSNEDSLFNVMKAEEAFVAQTNKRLRVWVDFYKTKLTKQVLTEFLWSTMRLKPYLYRLAIVGFSYLDKRRMLRIIHKLKMNVGIFIRFFNDPEDAKTWLVSE